MDFPITLASDDLSLVNGLLRASFSLSVHTFRLEFARRCDEDALFLPGTIDAMAEGAVDAFLAHFRDAAGAQLRRHRDDLIEDAKTLLGTFAPQSPPPLRSV